MLVVSSTFSAGARPPAVRLRALSHNLWAPRLNLSLARKTSLSSEVFSFTSVVTPILRRPNWRAKQSATAFGRSVDHLWTASTYARRTTESTDAAAADIDVREHGRP